MINLLTEKQKVEELLFKPTKDCVFLVDDYGMVQYVNSNIEHVFGYSRKKMIQSKIALLFPIKYYSVLNTYIYRCVKEPGFEKEKVLTDFFARKINGIEFPVEIQLNCCVFNDKKVSIIRIIDKTSIVTKVSETERQLTAFLEQAKEKYQAQTQFISKTSHELRTPLTTILNASQLLDKCVGRIGSEHIQQKNIDRIKNSVTHLTKMLNDFLMLNKIKETNKQNLYNIEIPIFIKELIENLQLSANITYKHIGNSIVKVDRDLLYSVCGNLISNAIKYSLKNEEIEFTTTIKNNFLIIICKDNGIGIPKEAQKKLFDPYYRATNVINIQGTGLGLSIVKEFVEKAGGKLSFTTMLDKGSIFNVSIPIID